MTNLAIEYLTDAEGNPKAVVIPIELWRKLLPQASSSLEELAENLEDYSQENTIAKSTRGNRVFGSGGGGLKGFS